MAYKHARYVLLERISTGVFVVRICTTTRDVVLWPVSQSNAFLNRVPFLRENFPGKCHFIRAAKFGENGTQREKWPKNGTSLGSPGSPQGVLGRVPGDAPNSLHIPVYITKWP